MRSPHTDHFPLSPKIEGESPNQRATTHERPARRRSRWHIWAVGGCLALSFLLVISCAAISGVGVGIYYLVTHEQEVSASATQSFSVSGAPTLFINATVGDVKVLAGPAGALHVTVTKRARALMRSDAQQAISAMRVTLTQQGDTLRITALTGDDTSAAQQRMVDLTIIAPARTQLDAQVDVGAALISDITGMLIVETRTGSIDMENVTFEGASRARIEAGSTQIAGALEAGSSLDVQVNAGDANVALPSASAIHLDATAATGDVTVTGWPITTIHSGVGAHASGDTSAAPTATLTMRVDTGSVTLNSR